MQRFDIKPLVWSIFIAAIIAMGFYFIDIGIASAQKVEEVAPGYGSILTTAKWLLIGGIILKGIISTLSHKKYHDQ